MLLQRCADIEGKNIRDIVHSLLHPELQKYSHSSLEEWEQAEEAQEMTKMLQDFSKDASFDPNHIPFDLQILGLRRKLEELDREITGCNRSQPELEKLRFSLVEELNFAEKEALKKQQEERASLSRKWKEACRKFPL